MEGCIYNCKTGLCLTHGITKAEEEKIAAKAKSDAEYWAMVAEYKRRREEADNTGINVVPIILEDNPVIEVEGMFFNKNQIAKEDEPQKELVIKKDVLDRSTSYILGRFKFDIQNRAKIVFEVDIDGRKIDGFGTNLPYQEKSGVYDTTLFKYPNWTKANSDGTHKVHVKAGLITGIAESQLGLITWGKVKAITEADFTIKLLPHEIID
ncbi:MAG: hypothetical protein WCB46_07120 [Methanoregula sp.]